MAALEDVSLTLAPGEVLAVVGENGAGKSTLMNVLYGLYRADAGEIRLDGMPRRWRTPGDAIAAGVGMVHQHFMLAPSLTVAESVVLGAEPSRAGLFHTRAAEDAVRSSAAAAGFSLDPTARIEDLSVGAQQKVEILKVLFRGARYIVLDEPTAVLTPQETHELLQIIRSLRDRGHGVVLISHKLGEVLAVADRIAVMRRGRLVAQTNPKETTATQLADLMLGETPAVATDPTALETLGAHPERDLSPGDERDPSTSGGTGSSPALLELSAVETRAAAGRVALRGITLSVRSGEVLGVAGVDGNGQRELADALTGMSAFGAGTYRLDGMDMRTASPAQLRARGVASIPEDRLKRAIIGELTVEENLALGRHRSAPFARGALIDAAGRARAALGAVQAYDVRPPLPSLRMAALSGGNQQKVVIARELAGSPRLLVAVQPTRGLDIRAVAQVHARLLEARARGAAVVLLSLDLDETLALSDRIVVLYRGELRGEQRRGSVDVAQLGRWMMGMGDA